MTSSFQIDGADVVDPITFTYAERFSPFADAYGMMVVSAFYEATATLNPKLPASFTPWINASDGASHSIKCQSPTSSTMTTFSNVYIEYLSADISAPLYFFGPTFRVWHINLLSIAAFGA